MDKGRNRWKTASHSSGHEGNDTKEPFLTGDLCNESIVGAEAFSTKS